MHELAIAESIMHTVLAEMERHRLDVVTEIGVRVGALSGVMPDALEFSFEAIVGGTVLDGARLKIETVSIEGRCGECTHSFLVEELLFCCPKCRSTQIKVDRGFELDIAYVEVPDSEEGLPDDSIPSSNMRTEP